MIAASNEKKQVVERPEAISRPCRRGHHEPNSEITENTQVVISCRVIKPTSLGPAADVNDSLIFPPCAASI